MPTTTRKKKPVVAAVAPAHSISELIDPSESLYRLTVEEYERIGEFLNDPRVELIDGLLVTKMTKKPPHVVACELTRAGIDRLAPAGWHTRAGDPVRVPRRSEPEPDIALVRGDVRDYSTRHPSRRDLALVVEVSDRSLAKDRRRALVYGGRGGIAVYWIVNLTDRLVEVYTQPGRGGYLTRVDFAVGTSVPLVIDGLTVGMIRVEDMLP